MSDEERTTLHVHFTGAKSGFKMVSNHIRFIRRRDRVIGSLLRALATIPVRILWVLSALLTEGLVVGPSFHQKQKQNHTHKYINKKGKSTD